MEKNAQVKHKLSILTMFYSHKIIRPAYWIKLSISLALIFIFSSFTTDESLSDWNPDLDLYPTPSLLSHEDDLADELPEPSSTPHLFQLHDRNLLPPQEKDNNLEPTDGKGISTESGTTTAPAQPTPAQQAPRQAAPATPSPAQTQAPAPSTVAPQAAPTAPAPRTPVIIRGTGTEEDARQGLLINFNNVGVIEFIRFISRASNKNFIFDDNDLQFNVTIVSEEPTSIDNIMTALIQVLRVHGLMLVEQGNNILIHNSPMVNQVSRVVTDNVPSLSSPGGAELITRVFRLNTLGADKAAIIIQPLTSNGALVEVLQDTGHLIVTDLTTNVEKIGELLSSLDSPVSGLAMGQYLVVNALLDSLIPLAEQVMAPIAEGKPLVFVAHVPSNSVFVVSTPFLVDRALAVLRTLDINEGETRIFTPESLRFTGTSQDRQGRRGGGLGAEGEGGFFGPGGEGGGGLESSSPWAYELPSGHIEKIKFYIHKLKYRRGEQIVDALSRVANSLLDNGVGNVDLIASIQSIQWLESSNSLVFTGTAASIGKVKELIEEIDTPLRQVFIEMLILETTLDDSLNYGVNWGSRFNNGDVAGSQAFLGTANTLAAALDTAIPGVNIDPTQLARNLGYNLGIIGRNITRCGVTFSSIGALVSALHDKSKVDIIMNPKLLVEDNAPAEIFVGINTRFKTQSITNDQGNIITNNFEFRDVGTRFRVTPLIGNNDIITLDILEEVSSVVANAADTGALDNTDPGPTTRISKTTTKVHVPNNYFLVMSGMVQDEYDRRRIQVPCLGGAPIIGALFSEKRLRGQKRNLMVFIRPSIIDSQQDIDDVTRHQQDIFKEKRRTKKMWKYEVEEALDLLNVKEPDVSLHDTEQYNP